MTIRQYDYEKFAKYYDLVERTAAGHNVINGFLSRIFRKNKVKRVLDMTCGTGAQAIGLSERGFQVTASDISKAMLAIAKNKARGLNIKFYRGDIRKSRFCRFDAVIAIFNAIGHLSKADFGKAIRNVGRNLHQGGLFIFDIFNLDFMKAGGAIEYEYIDKAIEYDGVKYVRFNDNTFDRRRGILRINQEFYVQEGLKKPKIHKEHWDMQLYSAGQLEKLLAKNGFRVVSFFGGPDRAFQKKKSLSIFAVAQKR